MWPLSYTRGSTDKEVESQFINVVCDRTYFKLPQGVTIVLIHFKKAETLCLLLAVIDPRSRQYLVHTHPNTHTLIKYVLNEFITRNS